MALNKIQNIAVPGVQLVDVNPEKNASAEYSIYIRLSNTEISYALPIQGYKKISINLDGVYANYSIKQYAFKLLDGTITSRSTIPVTQTWTDYIDIPNNALTMIFYLAYNVVTAGDIKYSLLS